MPLIPEIPPRDQCVEQNRVIGRDEPIPADPARQHDGGQAVMAAALHDRIARANQVIAQNPQFLPVGMRAAIHFQRQRPRVLEIDSLQTRRSHQNTRSAIIQLYFTPQESTLSPRSKSDNMEFSCRGREIVAPLGSLCQRISNAGPLSLVSHPMPGNQAITAFSEDCFAASEKAGECVASIHSIEGSSRQ